MYVTNTDCSQITQALQQQQRQHEQQTEHKHPPTCIVIGCRNSYPNPSVKFYQVPGITQLTNDLGERQENNISRQWYINTLREDLLDYILAKSTVPLFNNSQVSKQPHYVCIEHFDEESFVVPATEAFLLKEDAVPSLFEIEVFQKMIAHQEQTALNQQKQQKILSPSSTELQNTRDNCNDFLSNLILNNGQHKQQQHLNLNLACQKPSEKINQSTIGNQPSTPILNTNFNSPISQQQQQKQSNISPTSINSTSSNKRARMDPDTRAALIQRVPKAVKRTAVLPPAPLQRPSIAFKAQKAVKHTNPLLNLNSTAKSSKTVKYPSSGISLKDILPPPIMQSTKRTLTAQNTNTNTIPPANKAVKHPGGGSLPYYNSLNATTGIINNNNNNNSDTLNQFKQAILHSTINNLNETVSPANKILIPNSINSSNKIITTTTYIYKRVTQEPEIDLNLECEEEDLIYIMPPLTPPSHSPVKETEPNKHKDTHSTESKPLGDIKPTLIPATIPSSVDNIKNQPNKSLVISKTSVAKDETLIKKKENTTNAATPRATTPPLAMTKTLKKQQLTTHITPVTSNKKFSKNRANSSIKPSTPVLSAALEKHESSNLSSESSEESSVCDLNHNQSNSSLNNSTSEGTIKRVVLKHKFNANIKEEENSVDGISKQLPVAENLLSNNKSLNSYSNVLGKFYSRRQSSIANILEIAANELETSLTNKGTNKRAKHQHQQASAAIVLPPDLRVGNYPAKCNICHLILDNNIELTSHICSHLESSGVDPNGMSSYISPFDAVTTTCGICDATFTQPFDLIKHLDQKHMKQLGEYKCRICELQHSKLSDLVAHLNQTHIAQEMPYHCDACGFRTSFYADAIYHIKKEHKSTLRHFCPYCLKSLTLPYNEKLGYVDCDLFYAHLITHFNKHENDILQPSKCKHCQKCILHVRYMKDHLISDHTTSNYQVTTFNLDSSFSLSSNNQKMKKQSEKKQVTKSEPVVVDVELSARKQQQSIKPSLSRPNLKKRRRSARFEDDTADTSSTFSKTSGVNSPANLYDFDDQIDEINGKFQVNNNEELTESSTNETSDIGRLKAFKKYTKGGRTSMTPRGKVSQESQLNKKARLNNLTAFSDPVMTSLTYGEKVSDGKLIESPNFKTENGILTSPIKQPGRKQKALKQTNIKNLNINSKYHKRRMMEKNRFNGISYLPMPKSPEVVTMTIAGNVRVSLNKTKFKCVECGDTDVKSHFKNDYTCHQCKYNTNCSNSFEYHLHGHLVSKRVAMWNKVLKTKTEEYRCPCGFVYNSTKHNKLNANTGNKVAAHMLKCEYKYCKVCLEEDSEEIVEKNNNFVASNSDEAKSLDLKVPIGLESDSKEKDRLDITYVMEGVDKTAQQLTTSPLDA